MVTPLHKCGEIFNLCLKIAVLAFQETRVVAQLKAIEMPLQCLWISHTGALCFQIEAIAWVNF